MIGVPLAKRLRNEEVLSVRFVGVSLSDITAPLRMFSLCRNVRRNTLQDKVRTQNIAQKSNIAL